MPRLPAFLMCLGLLLTLSANSYAEDNGIYIGGNVGATFRPNTVLSSPSLGTQTMNFKVGYTFGGSVGYDFGNNFRLEWEVSYRENDLSTGGGATPQAGTSAMTLNGFYDLPLTESFDLYFGGGLGAATAQLETVSLSQVIDVDKTLFAYQLETGIGWNFKPKFTLSLGYRFFDTADPEFILPAGQRARMDLENHEFILKIRYRFNL